MRILVHDCSGHAFTAQLSRELARQGHETLHVYCSSFLSPKGAVTKGSDEPDGFEIVDIALDRPFERFSYAGYSYVRRLSQEVRYGRMVAKQARPFRPEVVLSSNAPLFSQVTIAFWCRLRGASFVWWLQDFYSVPMVAEAKRRLGRLGRVGNVFERAERWLARLSAGIVVISEDFRPKLEGWRVDMTKVVTIQNWATLEDLPLRPGDNHWSKLHNLTGRKVLMYSGTLGLKHNPGMLWDLAQHLKDNCADARLVVLSEGTGMDWLKDRNAQGPLEQLVLLPFQRFEEYADVLASADILVSILEPGAGAYAVPSKVLSYYCAGRPILAAMPAENLASRTIVETGSGVVVSPLDSGAFVEEAMALLGDGEVRAEMGRRARRYAEAEFGIEEVGRRFVERLSAIRGSSAGGSGE